MLRKPRCYNLIRLELWGLQEGTNCPLLSSAPCQASPKWHHCSGWGSCVFRGGELTVFPAEQCPPCTPTPLQPTLPSLLSAT